MSGSFVVFDSLARQLIEWIAPRQAIDFGAGAGKFGRMLRDAAPACRRVAVEPEPSYAERFGLTSLYDEVQVRTAAQWQAASADARFDLAILGDCIEQMPKSAGLDLLNALVYRASYILVTAPEFITQSAANALPCEARLSVWSERDLHWHDLWAFDNCRSMGIYLLRGYLPATVPLRELVERVNAVNLPVHEFHDPATLVRPARLRLVEYPRETAYRLA